ncbi:methyltransferase domain-containing protein [Planktomarina temperata]|nr:methyltransferase domain-containing protein [Planktomarina temperata]
MMKIRGYKNTSRLEYIVNNCYGKDVLHLGCTNSPETKRRLNEDTLIHDKIVNVAKSVIGIDLDEYALQLMRDAGRNNLYYGNVEQLSNIELPIEKYDTIVCGELIEHLPNPGLMLEGCRSLLKHNGELIISTQNTFAMKRFFRVMLFGQEIIHKEHTAYFSPATLDRLCSMYHFDIGELYYYNAEEGDFYAKQKTKSKILNNILKLGVLAPLSDGMVLKLRHES